MTKLYSKLASTIQARLNCIKAGNAEWEEKHSGYIEDMASNYLPRGSGIDSGCQVDLDRSTGERIVILSSFHCMNDNGIYYDGWGDFTVTITASLTRGIDVDVKSRNNSNYILFRKHDLGDYLQQTFDYALRQEVNQ